MIYEKTYTIACDSRALFRSDAWIIIFSQPQAAVLDAGHREDLKRPASKMVGAERRAFDSLQVCWGQQAPHPRECVALPQIKANNFPESHGRRTRFLHCMVAFPDHIGKPIPLLYYPPYHSKYHPVERCWGILEQHWNRTARSGSTPRLTEYNAHGIKFQDSGFPLYHCQ